MADAFPTPNQAFKTKNPAPLRDVGSDVVARSGIELSASFIH